MVDAEFVQQEMATLCVDCHCNETVLVVEFVEGGFDCIIVLIVTDVNVILFAKRSELLEHDLIDPSLAAPYGYIQVGESQVIAPFQVIFVKIYLIRFLNNPE